MNLSFSGFLAEQDNQNLMTEAFNIAPYELTFGKKSAGDIFFTFHDEDDKEFRIQFYTPNGIGKNVRQVYIGQKRGSTYMDSQQKFKNPMKVVASMIQATKEFLETPIGKNIDGFAINFSKKAMDRGISLLPKIIRQSGLKQKLNVMDLNYAPDEGRGYVWVVRKGKDPAAVFDGPKMKGITWDNPDKVGDVPVQAAVDSSVSTSSSAGDWNYTPATNYSQPTMTYLLAPGGLKIYKATVSGYFDTPNKYVLNRSEGPSLRGDNPETLIKDARIDMPSSDMIRKFYDETKAFWDKKTKVQDTKPSLRQTVDDMTQARWLAIEKAIFSIEGLNGVSSRTNISASVKVGNKGEVIVTVSRGITGDEDPATVVIRAMNSKNLVINEPMILRGFDITKPAALVKMVKQHVDDMVKLIDKTIPDSPKLDAQAALKTLQALSAERKDLYWQFRESKGSIFVDWDITFRRNSHEGAYFEYASTIRDANAAITRMEAWLKNNGYKTQSFLFTQNDAKSADIIAMSNEGSAYSEYEQSIGGSVKGYK